MKSKNTEELFIESTFNYLSQYSKDKLLRSLKSQGNEIKSDLKDKFIRFYLLSKPLSSGVLLAIKFCEKHLPDNPAPNIDDIVVYIIQNYIQIHSKKYRIAKDTLVWFRDYESESWSVGYYSHFENNNHYCFDYSKKSTETKELITCNIVTTENPLK